MEQRSRKIEFETIQISVRRMRCDRMNEECQDGGTGPNGEPKPKDFGLRKIELMPLVRGRKGEGEADTSSVTLVKTPTTTVVIDTGSKEVEEELKEALEKNNVNVEKVNVLVTTRIDPLHNGNDDIFVHALQHLRREEWSEVKPGPRRKVAINNRYHWIDRYLKLEVLPFPEPGTQVLLLHVPKRPELLCQATMDFAGQVICIAGLCIPSEEDPKVSEVLHKIRTGKGKQGIGQAYDINTMEELLSYCDHVIPGYGPIFKVKP
jgi:hypothetical protein